VSSYSQVLQEAQAMMRALAQAGANQTQVQIPAQTPVPSRESTRSAVSTGTGMRPQPQVPAQAGPPRQEGIPTTSRHALRSAPDWFDAEVAQPQASAPSPSDAPVVSDTLLSDVVQVVPEQRRAPSPRTRSAPRGEPTSRWARPAAEKWPDWPAG
jgi:hypothetical protein